MESYTALSVRVVVFQHLTDDAGGLRVAAGREEAFLVHGVENAAVNRLETVADVGERPTDDDGHRVCEERAADLVLDGNRDVRRARRGATVVG